MQWSEVISNPLLQNLPFKIELNQFGQLLMSPVSNLHGRIKASWAAALLNEMPKGEVITGIPLKLWPVLLDHYTESQFSDSLVNTILQKFN